MVINSVDELIKKERNRRKLRKKKFNPVKDNKTKSLRRYST